MKLVLLRHGQSVYNLEKKFCGWTDVPLTPKGVEEAKYAGQLLKKENIHFDKAYTSVLKRAIYTLKYTLEEMNENINIITDWRLNERHYGALQGLKHCDMEEKYGKEKVHQWRRSYALRPPLLKEDDPRNSQNDNLYKNIKKNEIPLGESLQDTLKRTVKFYKENIEKELKKGENILIVAHGNSLRSLIKYLENISDEDIINIEIATGVPYIYELDRNLKIINKYHL